MATPLRFRRSTDSWSEERVRSDIYGPLDSNLGAEIRRPWFQQPDSWEARRFEMDNGDFALFAWRDGEAYWLGNTETPSSLWKTDKYTFEEIPREVADWAERELLAQLHEESTWLAEYPHLSWFFLPVLLSKDGRHSTREFLSEHAAGFPDASRDDALSFYEALLSTGALDDHRYVMASKLGTSQHVDCVRMSSAMGEFNAAKLLHDAGHDLTPEIDVTTGHSIDFRADVAGGEGVLVEVTRPTPPAVRNAGTPQAAVRETAETKTDGQLSAHGGGVVLLVDCSSFTQEAWEDVRAKKPGVKHKPAVVFRMHPNERTDGYEMGTVPLDLPI